MLGQANAMHGCTKYHIENCHYVTKSIDLFSNPHHSTLLRSQADERGGACSCHSIRLERCPALAGVGPFALR